MGSRTLLAVALLLLLCHPAQAAVKIRVIFVDSSDSSFALAARTFKTLVEARSKGSYSVEVIPNGQWRGRRLGELDIMESVRSGEPEMCIVTTAPMANYDRSLEVLDTPFLFNDYGHVDRVLDGPVGRRLLESVVPKGVRGLAFLDSGFRVLSSSRPIATYRDFKGLRVRVMQNRVYDRFIRLIGAVPVPSPVDKIYEMAQKGYIDAADRSYPTYWDFKLYDVQKFITETNHAYAAKAFIVNEGFYQRLPPPDRRIIADAAFECRISQRRKFRGELEAVKSRCQDKGIKILYLPQADRQRMKDACRPIYDQLSRQLGPAFIRELTEAH